MIGVFGDFILDEYQFGVVNRLNPEGVHPLLTPTLTEVRAGGAGNVAANLLSLGNDVVMGPGLAGPGSRDVQQLRFAIEAKAVGKASYVEGRAATATAQSILSKKTRFLAKSHGSYKMILRVDYDAPHQGNPLFWDEVPLDDIQIAVISDYEKGAVGVKRTRRFLERCKEEGVGTVVNMGKRKDVEVFKLADVIVMNRERWHEVRSQVQEKPSRGFFDIVVTADKEGILHFEEGIHLTEYPTTKVDVVDPTGAGDIVTAVIAHGLARNWGMADMLRRANHCAGKSVQHVGTYVLPSLYLDRGIYASKERALQQISGWQKAGATIGVANGCFDGMHLGHIHLIMEARKHVDVLVALIDSDRRVKELKGEERPRFSEIERVNHILSTGLVDQAIIFDSEEELRTLIKEMNRPTLFKGEEYLGQEVVGFEDAKAVMLVTMQEGFSSTRIFHGR